MQTIKNPTDHSRFKHVHIDGKRGSLDTLIERLKQFRQAIPHQELADILQEYDFDTEDLGEYVRFNEQIYSRNSVAKWSHVEVLVMCWKPGQLSPIHNHKNSACALRIIQGVASEITYLPTVGGLIVPLKTQDYTAPEVISSYDSDVHQVGNLQSADNDLVTLHCYSPPLSNMEIFPLQKTVYSDYEELFDRVNKRSVNSKD